MKKIIVAITATFFLFACNNANKPAAEDEVKSETIENSNTPKTPPGYDPNRGIGKFSSVDLGEKLDKKMANAGRAVSDVKCSSCHKMTDEKLVGPGWKGVTTRYTPQWIMNFITNPDEMLDIDPKAQAQLEICLVRMPNQNLADEEARQLLEYMRENDGVK
ncbi:MAG: c-type cytochrome [Bacteroidota bacterium]